MVPDLWEITNDRLVNRESKKKYGVSTEEVKNKRRGEKRSI